jgi:hypothetical protein
MCCPRWPGYTAVKVLVPMRRRNGCAQADQGTSWQLSRTCRLHVVESGHVHVHVQEATQEDYPEAAKRESSSEAKPDMIGHGSHTTMETQKSASNTPLLAFVSGRHFESTCQTRASPEDSAWCRGRYRYCRRAGV